VIPIHHLKPFLRESLELKHFRENLEPYQSGHNSKYVNNDQSKRKLDRESIAAVALPPEALTTGRGPSHAKSSSLAISPWLEKISIYGRANPRHHRP